MTYLVVVGVVFLVGKMGMWGMMDGYLQCLDERLSSVAAWSRWLRCGCAAVGGWSQMALASWGKMKGADVNSSTPSFGAKVSGGQ